MLDDGHDPAGHEPGRSHHLPAAGHLGDLDRPACDEHVDASTFARRDHLEAADLVPGVDQDLDTVAFHYFTSVEDDQRAATRPPSAIRTCPVTKLAASDARNSAGPAISSGWAIRPWKLDCAICSCASGVFLRIISVSTAPGASAFTRMPSGANSSAIERVKDNSAAFVAPYVAMNGEGRNAPAEITLMTAAAGLSRRWGSASWTRKTGPRRFTSIAFSYAAGVKVPRSSRSGVAALFTTMSSRPSSSTVRRTSAAIASRSPTWVGTPIASPPMARSAPSVSAHASGFRLATATPAPAAANPSALDRPIPRGPPVTRATRPVRSNRARSRSRFTRGNLRR